MDVSNNSIDPIISQTKLDTTQKETIEQVNDQSNIYDEKTVNGNASFENGKGKLKKLPSMLTKSKKANKVAPEEGLSPIKKKYKYDAVETVNVKYLRKRSYKSDIMCHYCKVDITTRIQRRVSLKQVIS